jgi:hypothetical protein
MHFKGSWGWRFGEYPGVQRQRSRSYMSQIGVPSADNANTGWTTSPLWSKVDEIPYSDADYIISTGAGSSCKLGPLKKTDGSALVDPVASGNHVLCIRAKRVSTGGTLVVSLYQDTTLICTTTLTTITSLADYTYTLSAAEANAITDYTHLYILLVGGVSSSKYEYVTAVSLYTPETINLVVENFTHARALDNVAETQIHQLAVQDLSQAQPLDSISTMTLIYNLEVQDFTQARVLESPALTYIAALAIESWLQGRVLDEPVLTRLTTLEVQDLQQTQILESPDLEIVKTAIDLEIEDLTQTNSLEVVGITQNHLLVVQDLSQGRMIQDISLASLLQLAIQDLIQANALESVDLEIVSGGITWDLEIENMIQSQIIQDISLSLYESSYVIPPKTIYYIQKRERE